ncbi:MAG: ATP:cob(I)alamin adenosyltransferase [Gammaproteobacteria bacterium]|nr:MAG: ATP:cob(I)alamin adenosyltransferase [Gammaproteobacteria bacterium]
MSYRLTKIYTKSGDEGQTGLGNGKRVNKDDPRVEAYGTVDELNSAIGLLSATELPKPQLSWLNAIQHQLFDLGSELCIPESRVLDKTYTDILEQQIDEMNSQLEPLKEFILPGGNEAAARAHLARAICRRAERRVLTLHHQDPVSQHSIIFLNRLSDWFFVFARFILKLQNGQEVLWKNPKQS